MRISPFVMGKRRMLYRGMFAPWREQVCLWLGAVVLLVVLVGLMAIVQFGTPSLADNDGYYHIKMALLMRDQGLRIRFDWLPLSILSRTAFYDHHLLYHGYLALFVGDGSVRALIQGAKVASVLMPALAFLAIWWLLYRQGVRWAALWTIGVCALSEAFLYRMSMPRAQAASLLVLALGLHWLLQRRYVLLLPLGWCYVWLYNAFPLLLVLAVIAVLATLMTERRWEWQAFFYPLLGMTLGLLINPYFPQNIAFILNHLAPKFGAPGTSIGNEWYPYQTWVLIENSGGALAVWLFGAFALGWRGQRFERATLIAFGVSIAFGILLFKSRRFVEYFPAFALIFAALSSGPLLGSLFVGSAIRRWCVALVLVAVLPAPLVTTLRAARAVMADSKPAETYAAASQWLQTHTSAGIRVFQTDWDDFPRLFFYNTSNTYTIGLDPTYMQLYDARLYDEWVSITRGEVENPSALIREHFAAAYVISDLAHHSFMRQAERDPHLHEVYRDSFAVVYAVH